jgi:epoxyqueuosine reductase QueG
MLRKVVVFLEDKGFTAVPIHNPFGAHLGRPVRRGGTSPDGMVSLRVIGCAAGLGELGRSKLLLTPQFGPRQRVYAVLTDAALSPDPLLDSHVCDDCGLCTAACPADAIPEQRTVELRIEERVFSHAPLDTGKCLHYHQGWDAKYSPFVQEDSSEENLPPYFRFLRHRFRHHSICGARGCVRACMDHLEKTGRIEKSRQAERRSRAEKLMGIDVQLSDEIRREAIDAGADLVGIASIDRFDNAPPELHPRSIFSHTQSVIAVAFRMVRGTLKTIEEGNYWQAYVCDSNQHLNEILAPHVLRRLLLLLEDRGCTSVPVHNPFRPHLGRPVRPGGTRPDGFVSLRAIGCAAGLGEYGLSKLFLTPQFGPRQRLFALLTDAPLEQDPLLRESICDECGECVRACPANAIPRERTVQMTIEGRTFSHSDIDPDKCVRCHVGWDPRYSPFLKADSTPDNPPPYYEFVRHWFRHISTCGDRGCVRACMDHLEKTGRIEKQYQTPMIEGEQWVLDDLPA